MKHLFFKTTIFVVLFFITKPVFGAVVINEVAWMGTEISSSNEWIELYNNASASIDIADWSIYGADTTKCINFSSADGKINTIIPASGFLIYANNKTDLGIDVVDIWDATIGLNDSSPEQLILYGSPNCTGSTIDTIDQSTKWLAGKSATHQTMEKTTIGWQTSLNPGGTPKGINSEGATEASTPPTSEEDEEIEIPESLPSTTNNAPPVADAGDNIIGFVNQEIKLDGSKSSDPDGNELQYSWNTGDGNSSDHQIVAHKYQYPGTYLATLTVFDGRYYTSETITVKIQTAQITINEFMPNPNGTDTEEEWIEIYNDADSITDISGWQLDDIASGSKAFVFPKNTLIAPKSYLVFSRQTTKIALNNDKDSVKLLLPDGIVFQEINYEKPPQGKSSARTTEGFVWSDPSPGMANISYAINSGQTKKNSLQANPMQIQTVKEPSKEYAINLPKNKIEGGYVTENDQFLISNNQTDTNGLASIKQGTQNPLNLALLAVCIIFGAGFLGLFLVKIKKKACQGDKILP